MSYKWRWHIGIASIFHLLFVISLTAGSLHVSDGFIEMSDHERFEDLRAVSDAAEFELDAAVERAHTDDYSKESLEKVAHTLRRWTTDPRFLEDSSILRVTVLNSVTQLLGNTNTRDIAWKVIAELAENTNRDDANNMRNSLVISTFELAVEPPETSFFIELLFSLATNPRTRWAVFEAHRHYQSRLLKNAEKYGKGTISDKDCTDWISTEGIGYAQNPNKICPDTTEEGKPKEE